MFEWLTKKFAGQEVVKKTEGNGVAQNLGVKTVTEAYNKDPFVQQAVNTVIDAGALVKVDVKKPKNRRGYANANGVSVEKVSLLLNDKPNPDMDRNSFMRLLIQDLMFYGFAFIYHDKKNGGWLYPLKADLMEVVAGEVRLVEKFRYNSKTDYKPEDIIFIKDNGFRFTSNQLSGTPRLNSVIDSVNSKIEMRSFQDFTMKTRSVLDTFLETDAILNKKMKKRFEEEVTIDTTNRNFRGYRKVKVLDAGMKVKTVNVAAKDNQIPELEAKENQAIATAIGVPLPLLMQTDTGSISDSLDWFYKETVTKLMRKFSSAFEFHFGLDIDLDYSQVPAMQADIKKQADAVSTLTNNGLVTPNEGRAKLRYEPLTANEVEGDFDPDKARTPQNIAGSASNPALGGAPESEE